MPNGLFYYVFCQVHILYNGWLVSFYYYYVIKKTFKLHASRVDPNQRPRSAVSDQGLHCLPMSLLWDARLKWVKDNQDNTYLIKWVKDNQDNTYLIKWVKDNQDNTYLIKRVKDNQDKTYLIKWVKDNQDNTYLIKWVKDNQDKTYLLNGLKIIGTIPTL